MKIMPASDLEFFSLKLEDSRNFTLNARGQKLQNLTNFLNLKSSHKLLSDGKTKYISKDTEGWKVYHLKL